MAPPAKPASRLGPYWRGLLVLLALAVLTGLEFQLSAGPAWPLILIGFAKAALILHFFMHVSRAWKPE